MKCLKSRWSELPPLDGSSLAIRPGRWRTRTRIGINEALMFLRRRRDQREISIDGDPIDAEGTASRPKIPDADPDPETSYLQREEARMLFAALKTLRPGLRRAIELRELAELSTEETARRMGLSVAAVKGRLFHGRRKLHQALRRYRALRASYGQLRVGK